MTGNINTIVTSESVSNATSALAPSQKLKSPMRYQNLHDLQQTFGDENLNSYIVPELKEISENMRNKGIKV